MLGSNKLRAQSQSASPQEVRDGGYQLPVSLLVSRVVLWPGSSSINVQALNLGF